MAHAYTPGLQVIARTVIVKERTLPIPGKVLVKPGDRVSADAVIAVTELPGDVQTINVVNQLSITPREIHNYMLKKEGETVEENEPIAQNKPFLGIKFLQTIVRAPFRGTVERISNVTGQVILRKPPRRISLKAYVNGVVKEVHEGVGADIEVACTFIQGIFGIGGETFGELFVLSETPEAVLEEKDITSDLSGKLIVGGSHITYGVFKKAQDLGVKGIIVGGFHARDLKTILGYELGVAITGDEEIPTTLIITEGFGKMTMASRTFDLLKSRQGHIASISGRTQIRAGVMRPEIIIPFTPEEAKTVQPHPPKAETGIARGDEVRIIREPHFGRLGTIVALPSDLAQVETESYVRIMSVKLTDTGETVTVPRANVEVIEV